MTRVRARGEDIRRYIVDNIEKHPESIAKAVADKFGITRQAANKHLQRLAKEGAITQTGKTRSRSYKLKPLSEWQRHYVLEPGLAEDIVWRNDIAPVLGKLPDNVMDIWNYGFTEMFNNAIDHSRGRSIRAQITNTAASTEMRIHDDGVGIFRKIQKALNLLDERHAVLELAKGKLTTDPAHHSGEGIFFSSRMFDKYSILSGGVYFDHEYGDPEDWILEGEAESGTSIRMRIHNHTARTTKKVFDQHTSGDDYGFSKTVLPVRLAQYGDDKLITRSQAKRVLSRIDLFKVVLFDFSGVSTIGQGFADEIFRVFANQYPAIELIPIHTNSAVKRMISHVQSVASQWPDGKGYARRAFADEARGPGPEAGAAVVRAVSIPVLGGLGGGPWLDGRLRRAHAAIGYAASFLESDTETYANVARITLDAITELAGDVRAARHLKGQRPAWH